MTAPTEPQNQKTPSAGPNWRKLALAAGLVALIVILVIAALEHTILLTLQDHFTLWVRKAGAWGWLVLIALLVMHSFVPFPLEFAAVAAGVTYGFWLGTLLTWIGTVLGGVLSFWLSRRFGRSFFERILNDEQRDWIQRHSRNEGTVALLVSRLLPFMSFTLISYAAGLMPITWFTFIWTSALGMLPIIMISVLYGANIDNLSPGWAIAIPIIAIVLVISVYWFARRKGWVGKPVH